MEMFDPELLRTLVTFADCGSLSRTAEQVGRTPSAVTAQMQRLEETVGEKLLTADGRGRVLTPAGQVMLDHARRLLEAHRDAWLSMKGGLADGRLSLGTTQDFAETILPGLLRQFQRHHPRIRLELRIGRSSELNRAFEEQGLDVVVVMQGITPTGAAGTHALPSLWLAAPDLVRESAPKEIPLALLDAPCAFRTAAIAALEEAGRPYRLVATSASLSGLRAAVAAGLAMTLRSHLLFGPDITKAPSHWNLPTLPMAHYHIRVRQSPSPAAQVLAALFSEALDQEALR